MCENLGILVHSCKEGFCQPNTLDITTMFNLMSMKKIIRSISRRNIGFRLEKKGLINPIRSRHNTNLMGMIKLSHVTCSALQFKVIVIAHLIYLWNFKDINTCWEENQLNKASPEGYLPQYRFDSFPAFKDKQYGGKYPSGEVDMMDLQKLPKLVQKDQLLAALAYFSRRLCTDDFSQPIAWCNFLVSFSRVKWGPSHPRFLTSACAQRPCPLHFCE